ncbi:MAG: hypothetical protein AAGB97_03325 [Dehalococcoidia bacterium]
MNKVMKNVVNEIDQKFKCLQINFEDYSWRKDIPSEAGWYLIKTNTPIKVLKFVEPPKPEHKAHINIPKTIKETSNLQKAGIAITQYGNQDYVVYNGQAKDLRARAREHENGHPKTYCLGLSNYESLRGYRWTFCYVAVSSCKLLSNMDDKPLRLAVEQGWRAKNGWPILCKK